jgi:uncharacterized protein YdeI (YjbR/CyaY-like superfamily)
MLGTRQTTARAETLSEAETLAGVPTVDARSTREWRDWLSDHGRSEVRAALVIYHRGVAPASMRYADAVEQALCFGWVDYLGMKRDDDSFYLLFTPRKPGSTWSRANRERAERMIESGSMTPAGQALVDLAQRTGRWQAHPDADDLMVPPDLEALFSIQPVARANFLAFPASSRRLILRWISAARKPETRQRRIDQTVSLAADNIRANQPDGRVRPQIRV